MPIDQKLIYNQEKITLLLPVIFPSQIMSDTKKYVIEYQLVPKNNFHITIIGYATGEKIQEILSKKTEQEKKDSIQKVQAIADLFAWQYSLLPDNFYITKTYDSGEIRKSIIVPVYLPDLKSFYKDLEYFFECSFDIPFPHITMYTHSTEINNMYAGIGIYSEREFKALLPISIV